MPINVSTPDGSNFSFPDGTPEAVIKNALDKHFGRAAPQPAGGDWDRYPPASPPTAHRPATATNAFDQFDAAPAAGGNPFDRFDAPAQPKPSFARGGDGGWWRSDPVVSAPPRGFVLDQPQAGNGLPPGFVLDHPGGAGASAPKEDISAGMVLSGVPVLGAYVPKAEAAIRAAAHPLTGVGAEGATFSERYAKNLPTREQLCRQVEQEQPIASAAAQTLGGVLALAPAGATSLGARLLGMVGGPFWRQAVASGISGAALNAADTALRGGNAGEGAAIGALTGPGGMVAGRATALGERSAAGRVARSLHRSPAQNAAEARFVDQMGRYGAVASRTLAAGNSGVPDQ